MNLTELINIFSLILTQKNEILLQKANIVAEKDEINYSINYNTSTFSSSVPQYTDTTTSVYGARFIEANMNCYITNNGSA